MGLLGKVVLKKYRIERHQAEDGENIQPEGVVSFEEPNAVQTQRSD